ncbi:hypothetical protein GA0115261_102732 [Streptomyces sp. OspMP-M43]|nr:hypothetical protein GA0115261_102732 [Streptomyces sp. OspMP-M43]
MIAKPVQGLRPLVREGWFEGLPLKISSRCERPALRNTVRHSGIELIQHTVPLAAKPPAVLTAMSRIAAALTNKS